MGLHNLHAAFVILLLLLNLHVLVLPIFCILFLPS